MEFGAGRSGCPELHDMLAEYIYSESPELVCLVLLPFAAVPFHFPIYNFPFRVRCLDVEKLVFRGQKKFIFYVFTNGHNEFNLWRTRSTKVVGWCLCSSWMMLNMISLPMEFIHNMLSSCLGKDFWIIHALIDYLNIQQQIVIGPYVFM